MTCANGAKVDVTDANLASIAKSDLSNAIMLLAPNLVQIRLGMLVVQEQRMVGV